ncbi:MAG: small ribosomal subunit Rsm22 family protein, partial [Nitrospinota bacterium]
AHFNMGAIFFEEKKYTEAAWHFQEVLPIRPGDHAAKERYDFAKKKEAKMNSPDFLKTFITWTDLRKHTLRPNMPEHEILKNLSKLSDLFIIGKGGQKEYAASDEAVSAYTLFYLPTNFVKLAFILNQLPSWALEEFRVSHFIDIGTGPGTYLLAFLAFFQGKTEGKLFGIDRSERMLRQAKILLEYYFPEKRNVSLQNVLPRQNISGKKILFFGHSMNELGFEKTFKLIKEVEPDHLVILEPGTKRVFKDVLKLRSEMIQAGYQTLYPCPAGALLCPMESDKDDNWCHQVIRTTHDPGVERLSQLFSKDRRTMPLISHVYSKNRTPLSPGFSRVVRRFPETKFSYIWEVCVVDCNTKNIKVKVLKKGLSKEQQKKLKKWDTGNQIKFEGVRKINDRYFRVTLKNL